VPRLAKTTIPLLALVAALLTPAAAQALPRGFFGIAPQTSLTEKDGAYMKAGGIGSIRMPMVWAAIQPTEAREYDWSGTDPVVEVAARHGLTVLPFLYSTPSWLTKKPTTLPVENAREKKAWSAFVEAAVHRYGPGGEFWDEHGPTAPPSARLTPQPIRTWQIWNEANFFYFAFPVSPSGYARTLALAHSAVKAVDPAARVLLSGLFGKPDEGGRRGMPAASFLRALYRVPGIKADFDGVALHPYAFHVDDLEALVEGMREVVVENHDGAAGLYITEMGWGSQNDSNVVAFEQGIAGQARELRKAYAFLIANRARLNLKGTYWYSWKDNPEYTECSFCDSVGLFSAGPGFHPKPAWTAFVGITHGRARP
jgi:glycosyl hydrolase family 42 (putative beta-galactosidase)